MICVKATCNFTNGGFRNNVPMLRYFSGHSLFTTDAEKVAVDPKRTLLERSEFHMARYPLLMKYLAHSSGLKWSRMVPTMPQSV